MSYDIFDRTRTRRGCRRGRKTRSLFVICLLIWTWHLEKVEPMDLGKPSTFASLPLDFEATAYCLAGITRSGAPVGPGIVAADPRVLPMGTMLWLEAGEHSGVYQVMDTGKLVKGRIIDVFIPTEESALEFGRRKVTLIVLRYGHPKRLLYPQWGRSG